jgi:hypothetical protein
MGTFLSGSTFRATADSQAPNCDSISNATAPGVWYTFIGKGGAIIASTCTKTDFDSQISVFTGSCGQLACADGNNTGCGTHSLFNFIQDEIYHILVHGFGDAPGDFALRIIPNRLATLFDQALQDLSSPQFEAFDWLTNKDSTDLQSTLSDDELVERFALLVLHFTTGGARKFDFPLITHCSWNSAGTGNAFVEGVIEGFFCNEEGSVVTLELCKFLHLSTC